MTFVSNSAIAHGQQTINIKGGNTSIAPLIASVADNVKAPLTVSNASSASPAVLAYGFTPQVVTVVNSSSTITATNITATGLSPNVTPNYSNCTTLSPGQTCLITLKPQVNAAIGPTAFTITGTESTSETAYYQIITYGEFYQAGYIFALFDGTPLTGGIADQTDAGSNFSWTSFYTTSVIAPDIYNGLQNTQNIINTEGTVQAASTCYYSEDASYNDWYLPAICQLANPGGQMYIDGSQSIPNFCQVYNNLNMYQNLYATNIGGLSTSIGTSYWGSTQSAQYGGYESSPFAWTEQFAQNFSIPQVYYLTNSVRCARNF